MTTEERRVTHLDCLEIGVADWYERPDFRAWFARPSLAKWSTDPESELADCFMVVDYDGTRISGSDLEEMTLDAAGRAHYGDLLPDGPNLPLDIITDLAAILSEQYFRYGVVRLVNDRS